MPFQPFFISIRGCSAISTMPGEASGSISDILGYRYILLHKQCGNISKNFCGNLLHGSTHGFGKALQAVCLAVDAEPVLFLHQYRVALVAAHAFNQIDGN